MRKKCCEHCVHVDLTDEHWDLSMETKYCDLGKDEFDLNNGCCEDYIDHRAYIIGTCDICGREYDLHEKPYLGGVLLGSKIRIERYLGGKLEIRDCNVCEYCATRMMNYVNHLKATERTR